MIPAYATALALLFVAVLMVSSLKKIKRDNLTEAVPVVITVLMMSLTFSITEGIAMGFISYVVIKLLAGKHSDLNLNLYSIAVLLVFKYLFL